MEKRGRRGGVALDGYESGPDAPIRARALALTEAPSATSLIMVEGISDQIALEALAVRRGRDLGAEGVVILPIGGAHAVARDLTRFGPQGQGLALAGLCDAAEAEYVRRGLVTAGLGTPQTRTEMEELGFFVCVDDLEDELIRACGRPLIENVLDAEGDLSSLRTLQQQPAWRGGSFEGQMRRFLGAGSRRKLRYAQALVQALDLDRMPRPLDAVLRRSRA